MDLINAVTDGPDLPIVTISVTVTRPTRPDTSPGHARQDSR
jgi:hypothetical protein